MLDWNPSKIDISTCLIASLLPKDAPNPHTYLPVLHTCGFLLSQNAHLEVLCLAAQRSE